MVERALLGGRYEVGVPIGAGGFATVFRGRDRQANLDVAIKLVARGLDGGTQADRLRVEAAALKKITSRHVARVHDFGEDESNAWLVTELVDGVPLAPDALGRALLPHEVLRVARGLLEGLSAAHEAGIVHADVKPRNILLPRAKDALDGAKLVDFGLARMTTRAELARELGEELPASGVVFGTARYMAPEVLTGSPSDARADLYAAGLVLFELLGEGALFHGATTREELRARLTADPSLDGRVPPPLSLVLARMLARDPRERYADAADALSAIVDLDTAPVVLASEEAVTSVRHGPISAMRPPARGTPLPNSPTRPPEIAIPSATQTSLRRTSSFSASPAPPSVRPSQTPSSSTGVTRVPVLPPDPSEGLFEVLYHLDLAMLDAFARRERGNANGRIARATALVLRLELDAAALILEPLLPQSDLARALGISFLLPRARRITRARVESDRDDRWLDTMPANMAALCAAAATALSNGDELERDARRCKRALERLAAEDQSATAQLRLTLEIAATTTSVRSSEIPAAEGVERIQSLIGRSNGESRAATALDRILRGLLTSMVVLRVDEALARDELERVARVAVDCGATLFEVCASTSWGRLLVLDPSRAKRGMVVLERTTSLLSLGDVPLLEHDAEHHLGAALAVEGHWAQALPRLRNARRAALAERAMTIELLSASLEVLGHLAMGSRNDSEDALATLGNARLGSTAGGLAGLAWITQSLDALLAGEREAAEDALAEANARVREVAAGAHGVEAFVLTSVMTILFEAVRRQERGAPSNVLDLAAELEHFVHARGFSSFYWFDVLAKALERIEEPTVRMPMQDALSRLTVLLGPSGRLSRERRTSAPPSA
ncbi:Serine/threonine protein kinase PrkC, regulator of stationary phase [Labilithrix luteola]|uniref:Serine/threonine protein kinase PrkC, regulator of stationary phase n=1 Tax=Labilithrix luteola TaxID=1391654 RepID=A0A0K1PIU0_9BACT|nr:serine/threonine-protein kinase [Labilithrix luteola]AKU93437.1 Serine/threonine protein kinase PrkC, regulator of stationary phase [Labilithrix luteola]